MDCPGYPTSRCKQNARVPRDAPFHPLAGGGTPITILLQALNFHHFFFFGLAHVFHLLDFVVGEALDLFHGALFSSSVIFLFFWAFFFAFFPSRRMLRLA